MPSLAFEVRSRVDGYRDAHIAYGLSRAKVRYAALLQARDAGYDIGFADIRVRSLGPRETPREIGERTRDEFNALYPVGTPIRVYPGARTDESHAYDTVVAEPGAFILGKPNIAQGFVAVRVPSDWIAITHVVPKAGAGMGEALAD